MNQEEEEREGRRKSEGEGRRERERNGESVGERDRESMHSFFSVGKGFSWVNYIYECIHI